MIIVDDPNILIGDFLNLLEATKILLLEDLKDLGNKTRNLTGDEFETKVYLSCLKASVKSDFEGHIVQTGSHAFPDIIARKYFGMEVKVTTSDKWISTGNSILETTRSHDVERIYMFFGKLGGQTDIKYRSYQDCLSEIGVTHSPRYKIDMNLPDGKSIFSKIGIDYDILRKSVNSIEIIKDYYRKQLENGEFLWWIDSKVDDKAVSPIISPFRLLNIDLQEEFLIKTLILFPEVFSKSANKYERPSAYLVTEYNSVCSSLRDIFSAGGRTQITVNGNKYLVPKIFSHLVENAKKIEKSINNLKLEEVNELWGIEEIKIPLVDHWKKMIDLNSLRYHLPIAASKIYEWGLK